MDPSHNLRCIPQLRAFGISVSCDGQNDDAENGKARQTDLSHCKKVNANAFELALNMNRSVTSDRRWLESLLDVSTCLSGNELNSQRSASHS